MDSHGNYFGGRIKRIKHRIGCHPVSSYPHLNSANNFYPSQYPERKPSAQQVVVNNQTSPNNCSNKLGRMTIGGLLGGTAGYFAIGGKKSNRTILGTAIGSAIGAGLGGFTC